MPNFKARRENIGKTYPRKNIEIALYSLIAVTAVSRPLQLSVYTVLHGEFESAEENGQILHLDEKNFKSLP